jgi:hypothetical protein
MRLLDFTAATKTSAMREKLHRPRNPLNRQTNTLDVENALVQGPNGLRRPARTPGLFLRRQRRVLPEKPGGPHSAGGHTAS